MTLLVTMVACIIRRSCNLASLGADHAVWNEQSLRDITVWVIGLGWVGGSNARDDDGIEEATYNVGEMAVKTDGGMQEKLPYCKRMLESGRVGNA